MAATYDSTLATNKDHVRFLIPDTNVNAAQLSDEEITAVLSLETATGQALPYFAAARCVDVLHAKWSAGGQGVVEKQVGKLRIKRGMAEDASEALARHAEQLRERGAWLLRGADGGSRVFRML
jgi:hypothetical protein